MEPEWIDKVGRAEGMEQEMLEFAGAAQPNSRLGCQIRLTEALDGLVVRIPETQKNIGSI